MENKRQALRSILITGASFTGYNIGSGFATGVEAMQFFGVWGGKLAFISIAIATLLSIATFIVVYTTGYEQRFSESKSVYYYFFGRRFGVVLDYYIYLSMLFVVLTMMSGAGATISQYSGLPPFVGAALMCALCVAAALLGLKKLMSVLSYTCVFIALFVLFCGAYAMFTSDVGPFAGAANVKTYVARGDILPANTFGLTNPYLSGLSCSGLLITSSFAWVAATGALCRSKKEAVLSGVLSPVFYYAATAVVVYLLLVSMDHIAGQEVPMLAAISFFLPWLTVVYSIIIILAIFSTVSGRLFLIAERFGRGNQKLRVAIMVAISILAASAGSFIPFSRISNVSFSIMGAAGIVLGVAVLAKYLLAKDAEKRR